MDTFIPRDYQINCMRALKDVRAMGRTKALVVMASGLGKTLTSSFDIREFRQIYTGGRTLVLCHSAAILRQTKATFQRVFGDEFSYGMFYKLEKTRRRTDFLFATLQSMSLHRSEFSPDEFDYVWMDEAHHAPAETYRVVIEYFHPKFLLGMTATPDRTDDADLLELFGERVFEYDLVTAVNDGWLASIDYRLELDEMENLAILLDSDKTISMAQLNREIFVPKRDEEIARLIRERSANLENPTTVVFCQSIAHADRFAELIDAVVIHSELSDEQIAERLELFRNGAIRTVCAVDMLNEGIDIPRTDVIVFLRATESKVIFMQQLGRGLRLAEGKGKVLVLDFVASGERIDAIFGLERDFCRGSTTRGTHSRAPRPRNCFTLNIDTPIFKERKVDIISLLERIKQNKYSERICISKEEALDRLRRLAEELGRNPGQKELRACPYTPSDQTYYDYFGSLRQALILAGLKPDKKRHRVYESKEEIILAIQQMAETLGKTPGRRDINADENMPSMTQIKREFGSLNNAIMTAGLKVGKFVYAYTDDEMLQILVEKSRELGRTPTSTEMDEDPNVPGSSSYEKRFGSFNKAAAKAGLRPNQRHLNLKNRRRYVGATDVDTLIRLLQKKAEELGKTPTMQEVDSDLDMPRSSTFIRRFGSYNAALLAADLTPSLLRCNSIPKASK